MLRIKRWFKGFLAWGALVLCLGGVSPAPCPAKTTVEALAELSIEELMAVEVSSTSFFDIPHEKAPGAIYLIPSDTVENSYASSLSDLLAYYVPGVHISDAYSAGALYSTRGIATSSNANTLFMLDGEPMNTSGAGGINTNLKLPLLGYVDRVEVLKGPCSIIHGSGSINGFINVVQKNGADHPGGFVRTEAGFPDDLMKAETGYGLSTKDSGDFYLYAGLVRSDGIRENDLEHESYSGPNTRFSLNWQKGGFGVTALYQDEAGTRLGRDDTGAEDEFTMKTAALFPELKIRLSDSEELRLGLPIKLFEYDSAYFSSDGNDLDTEWQVKPGALLKTTRFPGHRIALGASLKSRRFFADGVFLSGILPGDLYADAELKSLVTSVFVEDVFEITRDVTLFTGLRYDGFLDETIELENAYWHLELEGDSGRQVTPRVALTWDLAHGQTAKFIYQEGYNNPDYTNILYYGDLTAAVAAEDVRSYEIGYHLNLMDGLWQVNLNAYYNEFDNSVYYTTGDDQKASGDVVRMVSTEYASMGIEAAVRYSPDDTTWAELSYAFSRPDDANEVLAFQRLVSPTGDEWLAYPEHTVKFNVSRRFLDDRLTVTLGCLYNGAIRTRYPGDPPGDPFDHNRFVVNAGFRYRMGENLWLTAKGENLFNNDVPATGFYYNSLKALGVSLENPTYTFGVTWTF